MNFLHFLGATRHGIAIVLTGAALLWPCMAAGKPMAKPRPLAPGSANTMPSLPPLGDTSALTQLSAGEGIRAQLRPLRHAVLSGEIAAKIMELPLREGERFKKGDRLVVFDCAVYRAQLAHSVAAERAASVKVKSSDQLAALDGISKTDLAEAHSQFAMASAQSTMNRAMVNRCVIAAPYPGRVTSVRAQRWSSVPEGAPLLEIYDDSVFELEMIVPSRWLAWLKPGYPFTMRVDETARSYPAKIARISGSVDPVSQTVKVFAEIGAQEGLLPGMSGVALLAPPGKAGGNVRR
jgi:membrane fusion protein, multidrug efflux system